MAKVGGHALRRMCGVFWNERTPAGWVEIQRDDEYGRMRGVFSDEEAAKLVCRETDVPGSCAMYVSRGVPRGIVKSAENETWLLTPIGPKTKTPRDAVVAVPAVVAFLAGLIDEAQLDKANREGT